VESSKSTAAADSSSEARQQEQRQQRGQRPPEAAKHRSRVQRAVPGERAAEGSVSESVPVSQRRGQDH